MTAYPTNPENAWILELSKKWNSNPVFSVKPMLEIGNSIINKLLRLPQTLSKHPNDNSTLHSIESPPTFRSTPQKSDIIQDLIKGKNPNYYDFVNRYGNPDVEYPIFLASMFSACEGNPWEENRRLYGALEIEATSHGLGSCNIEIPFIKPQEQIESEEGWTSSWTPPGAISHTHMDFYGSTQYFIHISGEKLWLMWPPTERNLEWFSLLHKQPWTPHRTLECIEKLEGLQLLYNDSPLTPFILKPNTLHACISLSSCIHSGMRLWSLSSFDVSSLLMEWGIEWIKGAHGLNRSELIDEADSLAYEISMWSVLVKQNKNYGNLSQLKNRLKELTESLRQIRNKLEVAPP